MAKQPNFNNVYSKIITILRVVNSFQNCIFTENSQFVTFKGDKIELKTWFEINKDVDNARQGLVIKNKEL